MNWWQKFLVSVVSLMVAFAAGHFLWPARDVVEVPGKTVIDSTAIKALTIRLDSVGAELVKARDLAKVRYARLNEARTLYADLLRRVDSLEHATQQPVIDEWPAAEYDTTVTRVTPFTIAIDDSIEQREVTQQIRMSGQYVLPPFNVFRNMELSITPSSIYYSRQLPGKSVEKIEVIRWPWLPVVAGYLGGTIITTLIVLLITAGH